MLRRRDTRKRHETTACSVDLCPAGHRSIGIWRAPTKAEPAGARILPRHSGIVRGNRSFRRDGADGDQHKPKWIQDSRHRVDPPSIEPSREEPPRIQADRVSGPYGLLSMPGHVSEAIGEYEAALWIEPNYAVTHYGLGIALSTSRHGCEAIAHMETALTLRPDSIEVRQALARLRAAEP
jgi:hypothetical protein